MVDLKNYICTTPFVYLEVHKNGVHSCCPSWLPNKISNLEDIETAWESEELKKVDKRKLMQKRKQQQYLKGIKRNERYEILS